MDENRMSLAGKPPARKGVDIRMAVMSSKVETVCSFREQAAFIKKYPGCRVLLDTRRKSQLHPATTILRNVSYEPNKVDWQVELCKSRHTFRGLEYYKLREGYKQRKGNKITSFLGDLNEQEKQLAQNTHNPETIADIYRDTWYEWMR